MEARHLFLKDAGLIVAKQICIIFLYKSIEILQKNCTFAVETEARQTMGNDLIQ